MQDSTSRLPEPGERKHGSITSAKRAFSCAGLAGHSDSRRRTRQRRCGDVGGREPSTRRTGEDRRPTQKAEFGLWFRNQGNDATRRSRALLPLLKRTSFASARESSPADTRRSLGISDAWWPSTCRRTPRGSDVAGRTEQNLAAIEVLAGGRALTESDRQVLAGYTGWGGLSIERVESRIPSGWRPDRVR